MEAKSVCDHFNWLFFGVKWRYSTRNGPANEVDSSHSKKLLDYSNNIFVLFYRITKNGDILPIIQNNFLKNRLNELVALNSNTTKLPVTFTYTPISIGKLRLILHVEHAMKALKQFGFTNKDLDEVKGIFSETNLYLLCGTMLIASVHVSPGKATYDIWVSYQTKFWKISILFLSASFRLPLVQKWYLILEEEEDLCRSVIADNIVASI